MHEAILYQKKKNGVVACLLCQHKCIISPGKTGICAVRENRDGVLYSLVYGKVIAGQVDPIEKKPLFHFLPGSLTYGVSTVGCNFRCQQCLNWSMSQAKGTDGNLLPEVLPGQIVDAALRDNCHSISYTYNEPTLSIEYNLELTKLAHQNGLKNVWVSNGYMSPDALKLLTPHLDAINIDLKAYSKNFYNKICKAKMRPVLENLKLIKHLGKTWLEITTLVIPGLNDSPAELKKIANFIYQKLGADTPWHLSKFSPEISWQLGDTPTTPPSTLQKAYDIGKKAGLHYVYVGNIWTDGLENTYCPDCNTVVIERHGFLTERKDRDGACPNCGEKIKLVL